MEKYEKPMIEIISIEEEIRTFPGLPCHSQSGNQDAGSSQLP